MFAVNSVDVDGNQSTRSHWPPASRTVILMLVTAVWGFNPARAAAQVIPTLPVQANAQFDGELEVQYEDSNDGARLMHYLHADNGQRLRLQFTGELPDMLTGSRIRARGALQGTTLTLSSDSSSVTALSLASPYTFGAQSTIVILLNFQDKVTQPYSLSSAADVTFTQTSSFYLENSYGQTSFTGTVVGWFTIAASSTTCEYNTWASLADQAATNAGVSLAGYRRRIYGFPQTNACSWWGLGTVGGNPSRAWINGTYSLRVVSHELGHNFGDYHSHSKSCDSSTCATSEYGDDHDTMGSTTAHLNAFQKERFGWLNYNASPAIQTVSTGNDYWIDDYESTTSNGPKALKIWNPTNSTYYYIESRARTGFDANVAPGVIVHSGSPTSGNSSYQIDLAPTTTAWDSMLDVGQIFRDDAIGLNVQTISASANGAVVSVLFETAPCVAASPTVSLSPSSFLTYNVTVTNKDGAGCSASPFSLAASVPSGWSSSFTPSSLSSIAPGSIGSATLTLTAPSGTSGPYSFSVNATNGNSGYFGSATASVVLAAGLDVTTSASVSLGRSRSATIGASVSSSQVPVAGAAVTIVVTKPNGATVTLSTTTAANGTASVKFSLKPKDPSGTYQVQTTASSQGGTGTGTTSFIVP